MSIQTIDNFELSVPKPVDNRIVVGSGFFYTSKNSIPLPYEGMRIYDLNDNTPYVYRSATWSFDIDRVAITDDNTSSGIQYLSFISATSGVSSVKVSGNKLRYRPSTGQIILNNGSATSPSLSFTSSSATSYNMGIYKSSDSSLAFSVQGTRYFEVGVQSITASNRFKIIANPTSTTASYTTGTLGIGISNGINFEFFPASNTSGFRMYNLLPTQTIAGWSGTTIETTSVDIANYQNYSAYKVRDYHYFNTESQRGTIRLGNFNLSGADNDQFVFYMKAHNSGNSPFSSNGGGLDIQNNLRVSATSSLRGTVIRSIDTNNSDYYGGLILRPENNTQNAYLSWGGITSSYYFKINSGSGQNIELNNKIVINNSGTILQTDGGIRIAKIVSFNGMTTIVGNQTLADPTFSTSFAGPLPIGLQNIITVTDEDGNAIAFGYCSVTVEVTFVSRLVDGIGMGASVYTRSTKILNTYQVSSSGVFSLVGASNTLHDRDNSSGQIFLPTIDVATSFNIKFNSIANGYTLQPQFFTSVYYKVTTHA